MPRTRNVDACNWNYRLGFGFSPIINDYKIVRACAKSGNHISRIEVYSLSTGSWKEI